MLKLNLSIIPLSLLLLAGCAQKEATNASAENEEVFMPLFDGQSLAGWKAYMNDPIEKAWSVQDGAMVLKDGSPKGSYANIMTVAEFDDFDLRWDWKIQEGSNSGLMFHVKEGPNQPYLTGPEYQMLDNEGFRGGNGNPVSPNEFTGSHYAIEPAFEEVTKPIGEWNNSRILVNGNSVTYWLNGVKTAEYEMHSDKWNQQVSEVKFAKWKLFATTGSGHIALQDHGHGATFKNIRINDLSK
ncbi:MAG: 3-keto-disaccharide hydrolase [Verrucomicrobiia bacterium]